MTLALLITAATGTWAADYTITLPTVSNGSVVAKVSDVSVTSAAADATVSLVATPDAGYKLKTISATTYNISETFSSGANTRTGTYFRVSGSNYAYGWRIGSGDNYTLTISSLSNQNLSQVVLTVGTAPNVSQRNISHLQADHGTLSATGTTQGNTITITGINSPTVTVSAPGSNNGASMWSITQAKVDGIGAITLTDTSDDNVKTFTMPSGNVTVSAEFEEPTIEVTINDTKTEATFDMPQYDVTATYTIKRDMTVDMTTKVGDGTDGVRFRIKKNAQSKYELVEEGANQPEVMDEIDAQNPTEVPAAGYTLQLQKLADDGETWENVSDYSVGTFRYVVTGQGDYDGIVYTNTFELFEGYVVKIPANEYITFFQKEMLYVEDEDVKIYTIVSVSDDEATATATEISVTSPNMPVLVKNNSAEDKNVLLIPTTEKSPDAVFVYNGFKGSLEATQIAASDDTQNNYAFNGMQFVWVKNAIDIDANKAWLEVPASNTAQARALTIVFSSETTGVELVPAFTTEGEGEWYDLNGRKLGKKPTVKGVYILRQADGKNTKKVAVE